MESPLKNIEKKIFFKDIDYKRSVMTKLNKLVKVRIKNKNKYFYLYI